MYTFATIFLTLHIERVHFNEETPFLLQVISILHFYPHFKVLSFFELLLDNNISGQKLEYKVPKNLADLLLKRLEVEPSTQAAFK